MSRRRLAPLLLALAVLACYAPSLSYGFVYDDHALILAGERPRGASALASLLAERLLSRDPHEAQLPYYRPLPRFSYALQRAVHGEDPAPFHAFNAVGIALVALCVYALLRLPAFGGGPLAALFGAGLVGLHPVGSSIAYSIANRETGMAALFLLVSLYGFLRAGRAWRALCLVGFGLALLCKEVALVAPALFALADRLGLSADPPRGARAWGRRHAPFAVVALAYLGLRLWMAGGEPELRLALPERPEGPLLSLLYTVQTLAAPFAALVYEPPVSTWLSPARLVVAGAAAAALATLARRHWAQVRTGALFWLGWMGLCALPVANLWVQETRFAERYAFLPLIGAAGIAAQLAAALRVEERGGLAAAGLALLLACGAVSLGRGPAFRDDPAFLRQWARTSPGSVDAHYNLGVALATGGDAPAAAAAFRRALDVEPEHAGATNNLAWLLATSEDPDVRDGPLAVRLAEAICRRDGFRDPGHLDTLAAAYAEAGRFPEAAARAREAARRARAEGRVGLAGEIEGRLTLYEGGRAFREDRIGLRKPPGAADPSEVRRGS